MDADSLVGHVLQSTGTENVMAKIPVYPHHLTKQIRVLVEKGEEFDALEKTCDEALDQRDEAVALGTEAVRRLEVLQKVADDLAMALRHVMADVRRVASVNISKGVVGGFSYVDGVDVRKRADEALDRYKEATGQ